MPPSWQLEILVIKVTCHVLACFATHTDSHSAPPLLNLCLPNSQSEADPQGYFGEPRTASLTALHSPRVSRRPICRASAWVCADRFGNCNPGLPDVELEQPAVNSTPRSWLLARHAIASGHFIVRTGANSMLGTGDAVVPLASVWGDNKQANLCSTQALCLKGLQRCSAQP